MDRKKYKQLRVIVTFFVAALVSSAVLQNNYILAISSVIIAMLFMTIARLKAKIKTDEREMLLREKAAQLTYAIFAPTIGIAAFLLLIPSHGALFPVFAKGNFVYLESLGTVFAYLSLLLIALYAISYHFLNKKYGGDDEK